MKTGDSPLAEAETRLPTPHGEQGTAEKSTCCYFTKGNRHLRCLGVLLFFSVFGFCIFGGFFWRGGGYFNDQSA